jgi:hypothetical protein
MARVFASREAEDFKIMDGGEVVGHLRVQPHAVAWCAKGKHKWMKVTLEQFAKFAEETGKAVKK